MSVALKNVHVPVSGASTCGATDAGTKRRPDVVPSALRMSVTLAPEVSRFVVTPPVVARNVVAM
jgi:hypothetical protein